MMSDVKWWQSGVVYQIYPRSFQDTTGNGVGDLGGIIKRLDYLNDGTSNSLGIDAIWISPFYPSPMADFGYDVSDYVDVHPLFGDLETFDRLVAEAHKRGIKIIIDYVPNHTSDEHEWFMESRSSRDNPKRAWYIWRDGKEDGTPPNNWGSFFGGPAWTWDEKTEQYYLHQFLRQQPDLNWRLPEVEAAMFDVLKFWLERGVDGFRMDVVGLIIKDTDLRDNPPNLEASSDLPENDIASRFHMVYNMDQDEVHPILARMRRLLDEHGAVGIGELWGPLPRWVRYYGEEGEGLHLPFNFRLMDEAAWSAEGMRASVEALEGALPEFAWPNYVLGNHDRIRLATRFGGQAPARLAAMLLLTLRGTPTLYYGDEIGLENGVIKVEEMQDPQGINLGVARTRDVARTPMQWSAEAGAGFTTGKPWLPLSADYEQRNVAVQSEDEGSILNLYRRLLWLRRERAALNRGDYEGVE
ncbi:MAG TPA: alpha-amylase family glycosyl hydrolase, partial [Anaerolineae bacterium]|nr:alpha-amylase family glycosyl hydrolase [Anaerolineae bacterium]